MPNSQISCTGSVQLMLFSDVIKKFFTYIYKKVCFMMSHTWSSGYSCLWSLKLKSTIPGTVVPRWCAVSVPLPNPTFRLLITKDLYAKVVVVVVGRNVYLQHRDEFLFRDADTISVHTVYHIDDGVCVGIVASPVRPEIQSSRILDKLDLFRIT